MKITPTGLLGVSPAVGMKSALSGVVSGQSVSGIAQAAASTAFSLSAIEIYTFHKTVFFKIEGAGKIELCDKTMTTTTFANDRVVKVEDGNPFILKCVPDRKNVSGVKVFRDNTDFSSMLTSDGTFTLTDVNSDTDISVVFQ